MAAKNVELVIVEDKEKQCTIPGCTVKRHQVGRTPLQKSLCAWHLDLKYPHVADEAGIKAVTDADRRAAKMTQKEYELDDYEPCKDGRLKYRKPYR